MKNDTKQITDKERLDFIEDYQVEILTEVEVEQRNGIQSFFTMFRVRCRGTQGGPYRSLRDCLDEMMMVQKEKNSYD